MIARGTDSVVAQTRSTAGDRLVDALLAGFHRVPVSEYDPKIRSELEKVLQRAEAYRSRRRGPVQPPLEKMVYDAWVAYERRLVAMADDPTAPALAAQYVNTLKPCYEWEGYHDCPEREARFAIAYLNAHPGGPFSEYLPLLAAHRWLCTAEAYTYEDNSKDAARSRLAYAAALSAALESRSALVRATADALRARGTCFPREQQ
jgi:hypothetical protein